MNVTQEQIEIQWGERHAIAELRRTQRRVLRVEVKPSGDIVVFAPAGEQLATVESRVRRKSPWIFREIDRIECGPAVTPLRHFLSGETHLLLGKPYRLAIEPSQEHGVRIEGDRLLIFTPQVDDSTECSRLFARAWPSLR